MRTELLLKLADLLDRVPEENFDMSKWAMRKPGTKCATVACALGWATTIPETRLKLEPEWMNADRAVVVDAYGRRNIHAAMNAFDLDRDTAETLFLWVPGTAKAKAAQIRELVDAHRA